MKQYMIFRPSDAWLLNVYILVESEDPPKIPALFPCNEVHSRGAPDFTLPDGLEALLFELMENPQDVFDATAYHLFQQGERSVDPDGNGCAYRGEGGRMCAAGPWLTDERVQGKYNNYELGELNISRDRIPHWDLLKDLQQTHDISDYWLTTQNMREALTVVATDHGLNTTFLGTLSFDGR